MSGHAGFGLLRLAKSAVIAALAVAYMGTTVVACAQTPPPAATTQAAGPSIPIPPPAPTPATDAGPRVTTPDTGEGYVLGVGDRVRVIVFGEETLSGEFVVDSTGNIALPLIGQVPAAGRSLRAFEGGVQRALAEGYLNDPRVSAEVLNFRPFYILGEVTRPGEYPYQNGLTVLNAVATAGGFTALANQTIVYIKRAGEEVEARAALTSDTAVQPGDTIRIAKGAVYILGEVNQPGEYPFTTGMTLRNAVAAAGGFTYRANQSRVFIQRQGEPDERAYRLTPDLTVQPGDTVRIVERFF
ncbi:MAG: SLBB domain-containing protein [Hyphomonadaceae bacterium]|nr:SLBB domain-containing protein [Hyphomonadaceae bacterium]